MPSIVTSSKLWGSMFGTAEMRALFTDEIRVDFTSLVGGEPATIPADALIESWSGNLTQEKQSFHLRGNHRIEFDGPDGAVLNSHGYAWNRMERGLLVENGGEALWEVWGAYKHGFVRTEQGWRVNAHTFFSSKIRNYPATARSNRLRAGGIAPISNPVKTRSVFI